MLCAGWRDSAPSWGSPNKGAGRARLRGHCRARSLDTSAGKAAAAQSHPHPSLSDPFLGLLGRAQPSAQPAGRTLAMAARPAAGARGSMLLPLLLLLLVAPGLLTAEPSSGSVIPAESRPCVDCHAFEFMQRALQDLKKTAYNLDTRTETLLLQAERRALCECWPAVS
ncbi:neuropeptide-like protein C4orf48 homolog [Dromiciops gliroides]|uniref:neuropeptide-like protein C4orf48 homolog n=1 Tax=Dromiciops gliroides TaxID=33562 RepID=UPI001CC3CB80|nr:neuropeptide-like protein C4orf48 homolog [Dromiciops gliroides]